MSDKTFSNMGQQANEFVSDAVDEVANRADAAVSNLSDGVAKVKGKAKAQFQSAADYVRGFDADAMIEDAKRYAQANPIPVLLGALAIGFLAGRAVRRD